MTNGFEVPDAARLWEMDRRLQGESEWHYFRNYLFRAARRPIYPFFDLRDIDEAHRRIRKIPHGESLEAARDAVLPSFPAE